MCFGIRAQAFRVGKLFFLNKYKRAKSTTEIIIVKSGDYLKDRLI